MIVLIDIGNSSAKYAFYQHTSFSEIHRIAVTNLSIKFCEQHFQACEKIVLASVGIAVETILSEFCANYHKSLCIVASQQNAFGVTSGYQQPNQLGVDRWLALVGAKALYPNQNCLIIDSGTATTIDLLAGDGLHHGGWILPGLDRMLTTINRDTANISVIAQDMAQLRFGQATSTNVNYGVLAATLGAIEQAIRLSNELAIEVEIVLITGGKGAYIASKLSVNCVYIDNLVFRGLALYSDN